MSNHSTNMAALKRAWEAEKSKGHYRFWKPIENGTYQIRFLPATEPDGLFYKATAQHKVGDNYFFCPKVEGNPCPICEKYRALWAEGTDASIALAREIKPKKQYLYNIVVRSTPKGLFEQPNTAQVYMSGVKVQETIMDYFFDADYGDLTDTEKGYEFTLVREDVGGWPSYAHSKPRKNPSPLANAEAILKTMKDLDAEVDYKTYEELSAILSAFLAAPVLTEEQLKKPNVLTPPPAPEEEDLNAFEQELLGELNKE